ncbi:glycosyltransferase [Flavobacterium sp.]|uniref:glycosyltransferase n=1 Tax=Flavobacterium sp. TaxID=239 RepID=UPI00262ECE4F|nr:glycosyltransferase [Flavobacterium sp.]
MKKIIILVDQMHSHGGIEKLVAIKANYWSAVFGYNVTILSTEQGGKPLIYELDKAVVFQDLAIDFDRSKSYFSFGNVLKLLKNVLKIQQYLFSQKPDFVLVASHIPITYVLPFLFKGRTKTIKEFHYTKYADTNIGLKNKLLIFVEARYDYLAVLSEEEQRYYFSKNTVVLPNPIATDAVVSSSLLSTRPNVAVAIVRFAAVKQLEVMVSIWSQFHQKQPDWQLHLYGAIGNDYYQKILSLVQELRLENVVLFKGQTQDVSGVLEQAKVLLLTSVQECFPMVILEANSVGVPVVSYDSPTGPRNIIHHEKDGLLVPYGDEQAFVHQLESLAVNPELLNTLGKHAVDTARNYLLPKVMNLWNTTIFAK